MYGRDTTVHQHHASITSHICQSIVQQNLAIKVAVLDSWGTSSSGKEFWETLDANWNTFGSIQLSIDVTTFAKENITYQDLINASADVLVISNAFSSPLNHEFTDLEIQAIEAYVQEGHGLLITGGSYDANVQNNRKLCDLVGLNASKDYLFSIQYNYSFNLTGNTHPIFSGLPSSYNPSSNDSSFLMTEDWADCVDGGSMLAQSDSFLGGHSAALIGVDGAWRGVFSSCAVETSTLRLNDFRLVYNILTWLSPIRARMSYNQALFHRADQVKYNVTFFNRSTNNALFVPNVTTTLLFTNSTESFTITPWNGTTFCFSYTFLVTDSLGTCYLTTLINYSQPCVKVATSFVLVNAAPRVQIIEPTTGRFGDDNRLDLISEIDDVDHDDLAIIWSSDKDGVLGRQGNMTGIIPSFGSHNISLEVNDGLHTTITWIIIEYVDVCTIQDFFTKIVGWIGVGGIVTASTWLIRKFREHRKTIRRRETDDFKKDKSEFYTQIQAGTYIKLEGIQQNITLTARFIKNTFTQMKKRNLIDGNLDKVNDKIKITNGDEKFIAKIEKRISGR